MIIVLVYTVITAKSEQPGFYSYSAAIKIALDTAHLIILHIIFPTLFRQFTHTTSRILCTTFYTKNHSIAHARLLEYGPWFPKIRNRSLD